MTPFRTIEFLEATAKRMPNRDIRHSGVMVSFGSILGKFSYWRTLTGGSLEPLSREQCAKLFEENQRNR